MRSVREKAAMICSRGLSFSAGMFKSVGTNTCLEHQGGNTSGGTQKTHTLARIGGGCQAQPLEAGVGTMLEAGVDTMHNYGLIYAVNQR